MWSSSLLLCLLLQNGTTPLVQDLLARIEALEKRVAELEQEKKAAPANTAATYDAMTYWPSTPMLNRFIRKPMAAASAERKIIDDWLMMLT